MIRLSNCSASRPTARSFRSTVRSGLSAQAPSPTIAASHTTTSAQRRWGPRRSWSRTSPRTKSSGLRYESSYTSESYTRTSCAVSRRRSVSAPPTYPAPPTTSTLANSAFPPLIYSALRPDRGAESPGRLLCPAYNPVPTVTHVHLLPGFPAEPPADGAQRLRSIECGRKHVKEVEGRPFSQAGFIEDVNCVMVHE